MKYRTIGKTGKKVSALGFGCMRLPILDGDSTKIDEAKAKEMFDYAIKNGINYFDTAYPYHSKSFQHKGNSEAFVGKALKDIREKVYIATKLPSWMITSRADMDRILDEQLESLQTDYIDFYLLHTLSKHNYNKLKDIGVFDFLEKAKADGKINHIGFSFHDDYQTFKTIINDYDWEFCQIQYNILDQDFQAGTKGLKLAKSKDMGVIIMEPLRGGRVLEIPDSARKILSDTNPDKKVVDWALSWIWNESGVSTVLSGMSTMDQLIENIEIAKKSESNSFSYSDLAAIDKVSSVISEAIKIPCTACGYCLPCPYGVDIPSNFAHYNNYYLFADNKKAQGSAIVQYGFRTPKENQASNCTGCRTCEEHCPQKIIISEEMKKVSKLFEGK